ncbi:unnamed protein product [Cuscuta campestris]|uniref:AP2/ERF domain-containing protein n=1 Tax=Cuscuta campestris TaxID=132261 RepID=A0A484LLE3_9ASTE|nr:unnamed protein product [Cuscuta campestris]
MGVEITKGADDLLWFRFYHKKDAVRILEEGPWSYDNASLLCTIPTPGENITVQGLNKLEIWVQVHGLPFGYTSRNILEAVGNFVGLFIKFDERNFEGHPFTWEWKKYSPEWVEERLDRAVASNDWLDIFPNCVVHNIATLRHGSMSFLKRLNYCGKELQSWDRDHFNRFGGKIRQLRKQLESMRGQRGGSVVRDREAIDHEIRKTLEIEDSYWRQRAKQFWIKEGDRNTKYFHNFASHRKRKNRLVRLRYDRGAWQESAHLNTLVFDFYTKLFSDTAEGMIGEDILREVDCHHIKDFGKYPGLPSFIGKNKYEIFSFILDKIRHRIGGWHTRLLSKAGKEILLKTVAQAMPQYAMSVFALPISTCQRIEGLMNKFWWQSDGKNSSGIHWLSWKRMTKPKKFGGLGFKDIHAFNLAMLGKQEALFSKTQGSPIALFVAGNWAIWKARNVALWEKKVVRPLVVAEWAIAALLTTAADPPLALSSHQVAAWGGGGFKCMVDAALHVRSHSVGVAAVLLREDGSFGGAFSRIVRCPFEARVGEAFPIKEALSWLKERGVTEVALFSDCLLLIQALNRRQVDDRSYLGIIESECRLLASSVSQVERIYGEATSRISYEMHATAPRVAHASIRAAVSNNSPRRRENHPHQYHGISRHRNGTWVAQIKYQGALISLGTYSTPHMAAAAYDAVAYALRGSLEELNFPAFAEHYPYPTSSAKADLKRVAALAAAMMDPHGVVSTTS